MFELYLSQEPKHSKSVSRQYNQGNMSLCKGLTKSGRPCHNKAIKGAVMCNVHQAQDHSPLTQQDNLLFSLPEQLLQKISSYLSVKDKSALAPVCRYFKRNQPTKKQKIRYIVDRDIGLVQDSSAETEFDNSIIYHLHEKKFVIYCKVDKIPSAERPIMTFSKTYFYIYDKNSLYVISPSDAKLSKEEFCDEFTNYICCSNREIMRLRDDPCSVEVISSVKTSGKLIDLKYPHKLFKDSLDICLISNISYF